MPKEMKGKSDQEEAPTPPLKMQFTAGQLARLVRREFEEDERIRLARSQGELALRDKEGEPIWNKEKVAQLTIWDRKQAGLCLLVSTTPARKTATVTLRVAFYLPSKPGTPRYMALGRYPDGEYRYKKDGKAYAAKCSDLDAVRDAASHIRGNAKHGIDPRRPAVSGDFKSVVKNYIEMHAKEKNRTWQETERIFNRYVLPEWSDLDIGKIKKSDIAVLLDKIAGKKIKGPKGRLYGGSRDRRCHACADRRTVQLARLA